MLLGVRGKTVKLVLLVLFAAFLIALAPWSVERQARIHFDFPVFYDAANHHGSDSRYVYPPLLAFLLRPIALFPLETSAYIWYGLTSLCFLWLLFVVLPDEAPRSLWDLLCALVFLVATARVAKLNFELGQVNVVVLLAFALSVQGRGSVWRSSLLGFSAALKLYPLVAMPYWLKWRGFSATVVVCLAIAVLWGVPWLCGFSIEGFRHLYAEAHIHQFNLSLFSQGCGWVHYPLVLLLLGASLLVAKRDYPHWWAFPALLLMLAPSLLCKAHLISGVLTAGLMFAPFGRRSLVRLVPLLWAVGSLLSILSSAPCAWFLLAAFLVLLYDAWQWGNARAPSGPAVALRT